MNGTADPTLPGGYSGYRSAGLALTFAEIAAATNEPYRDVANNGPTDATITPWPGSDWYQQYSPAEVYFNGEHLLYTTMVQCSANVATRDDEIFVWESADSIIWDWARTSAGQAYPCIEQGAGAWETSYIADATVLEVDGVLHLYYSSCYNDASHTDTICHATSVDGRLWTKDPANPVLVKGAGAAWDSVRVARPGVIHDGETFHMVYDGIATDYVGNYHVKIGHATSTDGSTWTKDPANPVIDTADYGDVDYMGDPCLEFEASVFYLSCRLSGADQGYAVLPLFTSPDCSAWTRGRDLLHFRTAIDEAQLWTPEFFRDPTDDHLYVWYGATYPWNPMEGLPIQPARALVAKKVEVIQGGDVVETPTRSRKQDVLFTTTGVVQLRVWNVTGTNYTDTAPFTAAAGNVYTDDAVYFDFILDAQVPVAASGTGATISAGQGTAATLTEVRSFDFILDAANIANARGAGVTLSAGDGSARGREPETFLPLSGSATISAGDSGDITIERTLDGSLTFDADGDG